MLTEVGFPEEWKGYLIGGYTAISMLGGLASQSPFSALVDALGWRVSVGLSAIPPFVTAVIFAFVIPSKQSQKEGLLRHAHEPGFEQLESGDPRVPSESGGCGASDGDGKPEAGSWDYWARLEWSWQLTFLALYTASMDPCLEVVCGLWGVDYLQQVRVCDSHVRVSLC